MQDFPGFSPFSMIFNTITKYHDFFNDWKSLPSFDQILKVLQKQWEQCVSAFHSINRPRDRVASDPSPYGI